MMFSVCLLHLYISLIAADNSDISKCLCGIENVNSRIVGGRESLAHIYPWLVSVIDHNLDPYCGASLISKDYVLTAAHCLQNQETKQFKNLTDIKLVFGVHDQYKRRGTFVFSIEKAIIHPKYKSVQNYDIALLKLSFPNSRIRRILTQKFTPICLPVSAFTKSNKYVVAGWGLTRSTSGVESRKLLEAKVKEVPLSDCRSRFNDNDLVTDNHLCAGDSKVDSCGGDSGGPLMQKRRGKVQLYGIASWGDECAHNWKPGIYTKVYNYLSWIHENTNDTQYCQ